MVKLNLNNVRLSKKDRSKGLILPKYPTTKLAYLCGILAGDGSIYTRGIKHDYIIKCVGNPKDEQPLYHEIIVPLFKELFNLNLKVGLQDMGTTYGFVIYSKGLLTFFTEALSMPCGKKYNDLKIPPILKSKPQLILSFIQGVADTDFSLVLKRGGKKLPYYPVISGYSKSRKFMEEISNELEKLGLKINRYFDYVQRDIRFKARYFIINRIEMPGHENFKVWMNNVSFQSFKHLKKAQKVFEQYKNS